MAALAEALQAARYAAGAAACDRAAGLARPPIRLWILLVLVMPVGLHWILSVGARSRSRAFSNPDIQYKVDKRLQLKSPAPQRKHPLALQNTAAVKWARCRMPLAGMHRKRPAAALKAHVSLARP
jgi:hypothetical protein